MSGTWADRIAVANAATRDAGQWRSVRPLTGGSPVTTDEQGESLVSFASNDYLGLSQHPAVIEAACTATERDGTGAGAARLIVGDRPVHHELETALARHHRTEAAAVFPTGFAANLGVIGALVAAAGRDDTLIVSDELNHASIIDGVRLSGAARAIARHVDVEHVEALLAARSQRWAIVVTDQVFSMDGDCAPVDELRSSCRRHGAILVLDVAHAVLCANRGWTPPREGAIQPRFGATADADPDVVIVGTLSKTLGSQGGYVAATRDVVDLIINRARSFIFTTGLAPASAAAAMAALQIVESDEGDRLRDTLRSHIDRLRPGHDSPIVPVVLGDERRATEAAASLRAQGILVPAIRPPTVANGTSRLRIALSAAHSGDHLEMLTRALGRSGIDATRSM